VRRKGWDEGALALWEAGVPYLVKRSGGREISGLKAYEQ
jgi:hypothetical protein